MNGGIDSQIQQAQLSAGNNPQALAQRYQKSRSLVDLLALQKLKSEKDAAARDIQMKMQTQPQTIVDQREQELMGANKQELMAKMGPTLARTGQQSIPQPAQSGIAQAAPTMGMKAGGIVPSFAEGGDVELDPRIGQSEEEIREKVRLLIDKVGIDFASRYFDGKPAFERIVNEEASKMKLGDEVAGGWPKPSTIASSAKNEEPDSIPAEGIASIAPPTSIGGNELLDPEYQKALDLLKQGLPISAIKKVFPNLTKRTSEALENVSSYANDGNVAGAVGSGIRAIPRIGGGLLEDMYKRVEPVATGMADAAVSFGEGLAGEDLTESPVMDQPQHPLSREMAQEAYQRLEDVASRGVPADSIVPPTSSTGAVGGIADIAPAQTDPNREEIMREAMKSMRIDPNAEGLAGLKVRQGLDEESRAIAKRQMEQTLARKALADQYNDPEKQRREQLKAFLLGAGNRSNFGSVMAGGLAGSMNARKRNEAESLSAEDALQLATQQDYENMKGLGDAGYDAYKDARQMGSEERRVGMQSATNMSNTDLAAQVDRENAKLRAETNALLRAEADYAKMQAQLERVTRSRAEIQQIIEDRLDMNPQYSELKRQYLQDVAKNRTEKAAEKRQLLDAMEADAMGGLAESMQSFDAQIQAISQKMGLPSGGGFNANEWGDPVRIN